MKAKYRVLAFVLAVAMVLPLCACTSLLPAASPLKPDSASSDAAQGTTASAGRLDDGKLRVLFYTVGTADTSNKTVIFSGKTVLHEAAPTENVYLVYDNESGEASYYYVSWADNTAPEGRRCALYDRTGAEVLAFDKEYDMTLTGSLLVLTKNNTYDTTEGFYSIPALCRVFDLSTGQELSTPENATGCAIAGGYLAFNCYKRPDTIAEGDYDSDPYLHTSVVVQNRAGETLRTEDACVASAFSATNCATTMPTDWLVLSFYGADYEVLSTDLYNPATGETLVGLSNECGSGTVCLKTGDSSYQLVDLVSARESAVLCSFDSFVVYYAPGVAITWVGGDKAPYELHDLVTGDVTPLYNYCNEDSTLAAYATDGTLRVWDVHSGKVLTDTTVEPVENQTSAQLSCEGSGYVWVQQFGQTASDEPARISIARTYGPSGLVNEFADDTLEGYEYVSPLVVVGDTLYYRANYIGAGGAYLYDVLDQDGKVLLHGLADCYAWSGDTIPSGCFVARKGFTYGWMDISGQWVWSGSIFSALTDDDGMSYIYG